jgi:hypothetical protein
VRPDLPDNPTIVREGIYMLWRDQRQPPWEPLHVAIREARRRLQARPADRGPRPNGPAARAAVETAKIYNWITGKEATVYWDAAASTYKGKCLPFLTEVFDIFGLNGDPAQYLRNN